MPEMEGISINSSSRGVDSRTKVLGFVKHGGGVTNQDPSILPVIPRLLSFFPFILLPEVALETTRMDGLFLTTREEDNPSVDS